MHSVRDDNADQTLFGLCEFYLAEDRIISPRIALSKRESIINSILNFGGIGGVVLVYVFMVMRRTTIHLEVFRNIALLDIKGGLMLNKPEIIGEREALVLQRFHFPSVKIIRELIKAYLRYKTNLGNSNMEFSVQGANSVSNTTKSAKDLETRDVRKRALTNRLYLLWLTNFYINRSICLANSSQIISNLKTIVTIEEHTPQIAGYVSAFIDMGLPIYLYLPTKLTLKRLTLHSLGIFSKIIAAHGDDADFIQLHYKGVTYLEKGINEEVGFNTSVPPRVGVFLSSYYESDSEELCRMVAEILLPFIFEIQIKFGTASVTVFCHPNDTRPQTILRANGISVSDETGPKETRLNAFDLVIVGNSSVAEEALIRGIPVVYSGSLDTYAHDLYGYVQSGLVIDATETLPTLDDVFAFYEKPITKQNLYKFQNGTNMHASIGFVEAICS